MQEKVEYISVKSRLTLLYSSHFFFNLSIFNVVNLGLYIYTFFVFVNQSMFNTYDVYKG